MTPPHAEKRETALYYGRQVILQILKSAKPVRRVLIAAGVEEKNIWEMVRLAQNKSIPIVEVSRKVLDALCKGNHQGIALESDQTQALDFKSFLTLADNGSKNFVSLLDEIQDPQNLGAILRSAFCFGCSGVVVSKWRSARITESVMRSSSGAAAHLPLVQISNLGVAIERLKEKGFMIYGAEPQGCSIASIRFDFPLAILFGNEHRGLKPILKKACDRLVSIPQMKTVASLNVAAAAAIFFYEIYKNGKMADDSRPL